MSATANGFLFQHPESLLIPSNLPFSFLSFQSRALAAMTVKFNAGAFFRGS